MKLVATRSLGDQGVGGMSAVDIADAVMKLDKVCTLSCLPEFVTLSQTGGAINRLGADTLLN